MVRGGGGPRFGYLTQQKLQTKQTKLREQAKSTADCQIGKCQQRGWVVREIREMEQRKDAGFDFGLGELLNN